MAKGDGKGNRTPRKSRAQQEVEAREKAAKAVALRKMGMSYDQIAREIGYNDRAAAHKVVQQELAALPANDAKELRKLENERLDDLYRATIRSALSGDLFAIDRVLKIMERRARLLNLDLSKGSGEEADRDVRITIIRRDLGPATQEAAALPTTTTSRIVDATVAEEADGAEEAE